MDNELLGTKAAPNYLMMMNLTYFSKSNDFISTGKFVHIVARITSSVEYLK